MLYKSIINFMQIFFCHFFPAAAAAAAAECTTLVKAAAAAFFFFLAFFCLAISALATALRDLRPSDLEALCKDIEFIEN